MSAEEEEDLEQVFKLREYESVLATTSAQDDQFDDDDFDDDMLQVRLHSNIFLYFFFNPYRYLNIGLNSLINNWDPLRSLIFRFMMKNASKMYF